MTREEAIYEIEELKETRADDFTGNSKIGYGRTGIALDMAIKALKDERQHGKWDKGFCSVCGERSLKTIRGEICGLDHTPFCKNCGADMRNEVGQICETMWGW